MIAHEPLLVKLVRLIDSMPMPQRPKRGPGRPLIYHDRLFLKALIIMVVKRLHKVGELRSVLEEPAMKSLKDLLTIEGRYPSRSTFERRLARLPETLPAQIGCFGRHLVRLIDPWATSGRAAALDSTVLRAKGGLWHKKDRDKGLEPHTRIDTEAAWTKSGWHGWVYGWKLHLAVCVSSVWIPLAAVLRPANEADNQIAPALIAELPHQTRFVLGDLHYNAPNVVQACFERSLLLVTTQYGPYPHTDDGVEVRRVFHKLRSVANENFNEHFKAIFEGHEQVPTKGLVATQRFALGAILLYQLALLYRHERGLKLNVGLKAFLRAA